MRQGASSAALRASEDKRDSGLGDRDSGEAVWYFGTLFELVMELRTRCVQVY